MWSHSIDRLVKYKISLMFFCLGKLIGDIIAKNPLFVLITGDFNLRSTNRWKNNLSTSKGTQVDSLTTSYGLSQIVSDPTHILPNSSSCIDLTFTDQCNLVTETGVHSSYTLNITIKLYSRNSISKQSIVLCTSV